MSIKKQQLKSKPVSKVTFSLNKKTVGQEHQFRYLVDGQNWINDNEADRYVATGVSHDQNSVIAL